MFEEYKERVPGKMILSVQGINFGHSGLEPETLRDIAFSIHEGEKVALVGPNGVGKTTLINIIRGEITPESGEVIITKNSNIGFLPQSVRDISLPENETVGNFIKSGRDLPNLETQMRRVEEKLTRKPRDSEAIKRYGNLQEQYEILGGYTADSEASKLLAGLELEEFDLKAKVKTLSGGQKTRLFLARVLFSQPNLLLLDEPTNHLDEPVLEWLSGYLKNFKGALIVISHHQKFLDATVSRVLRLNEFTHQIEDYLGNYTDFLNQKEERERSLRKMKKNQEKELRRLYGAINLWRKRGKRARDAKTMQRRAERIKKSLAEVPRNQRESSFRFGFEEKSYRQPIQTTSLNKSYDSKTVVRDVSFNLERGECLAILGPNGSGKSTLIKMIVGELEPNKGNIKLGKRVSLGYYAQEHEQLNFNQTVLEEARNLQPRLPEYKLRAALGRFLFTGDDVFKKISVLSPGERTRLSLAKLMLGNYNTLILDEPTNHLDMESRKRLMEVLSEFLENEGSIIITSHDEELLNLLDPDKILIMPDEKLESKLRTIP